MVCRDWYRASAYAAQACATCTHVVVDDASTLLRNPVYARFEASVVGTGSQCSAARSFRCTSEQQSVHFAGCSPLAGATLRPYLVMRISPDTSASSPEPSQSHGERARRARPLRCSRDMCTQTSDAQTATQSDVGSAIDRADTAATATAGRATCADKQAYDVSHNVDRLDTAAQAGSCGVRTCDRPASDAEAQARHIGVNPSQTHILGVIEHGAGDALAIDLQQHRACSSGIDCDAAASVSVENTDAQFGAQNGQPRTFRESLGEFVKRCAPAERLLADLASAELAKASSTASRQQSSCAAGPTAVSPGVMPASAPQPGSAQLAASATELARRLDAAQSDAQVSALAVITEPQQAEQVQRLAAEAQACHEAAAARHDAQAARAALQQVAAAQCGAESTDESRELSAASMATAPAVSAAEMELAVAGPLPGGEAANGVPDLRGSADAARGEVSDHDHDHVAEQHSSGPLLMQIRATQGTTAGSVQMDDANAALLAAQGAHHSSGQSSCAQRLPASQAAAEWHAAAGPRSSPAVSLTRSGPGQSRGSDAGQHSQTQWRATDQLHRDEPAPVAQLPGARKGMGDHRQQDVASGGAADALRPNAGHNAAAQQAPVQKAAERCAAEPAHAVERAADMDGELTARPRAVDEREAAACTARRGAQPDAHAADGCRQVDEAATRRHAEQRAAGREAAKRRATEWAAELAAAAQAVALSEAAARDAQRDEARAALAQQVAERKAARQDSVREAALRLASERVTVSERGSEFAAELLETARAVAVREAAARDIQRQAARAALEHQLAVRAEAQATATREAAMQRASERERTRQRAFEWESELAAGARAVAAREATVRDAQREALRATQQIAAREAAMRQAAKRESVLERAAEWRAELAETARAVASREAFARDAQREAARAALEQQIAVRNMAQQADALEPAMQQAAEQDRFVQPAAVCESEQAQGEHAVAAPEIAARDAAQHEAAQHEAVQAALAHPTTEEAQPTSMRDSETEDVPDRDTALPPSAHLRATCDAAVPAPSGQLSDSVQMHSDQV